MNTETIAADGPTRIRRGTNLPKMGNFNESVIVDAIRRSPNGLSRVELAATTLLSAQTISNICRRLLDSGLIHEAGKEGVGPGKPRTILRLDAQGGYAIGVHLDPAVMTFVLLDLTGAIVASSRQETPIVTKPGPVVATIVSAITQLIETSGVPRERVAGIGIAAPGPIDVDRGILVDPPNLPGWHRVELRDALANATGLLAILDKDVTAAAVAELWSAGETGFESFAFIYMGAGVGAGAVLHGDVIRGSSGNAGEIGHIVVDPEGPRCPCGLRGCVAVTCNPHDLVMEAVAVGVIPPVPASAGMAGIDRQLTLLCDAAGSGHPDAIAILATWAERISRAVAVITNMLDVDRVIFGGPTWSRIAPFYLERLPSLLESMRATREIHAISVVGTSMGDEVGAVGAACLVLDHILTPRPTSLLFRD